MRVGVRVRVCGRTVTTACAGSLHQTVQRCRQQTARNRGWRPNGANGTVNKRPCDGRQQTAERPSISPLTGRCQPNGGAAPSPNGVYGGANQTVDRAFRSLPDGAKPHHCPYPKTKPTNVRLLGVLTVRTTLLAAALVLSAAPNVLAQNATSPPKLTLGSGDHICII